MLLDSFVRSLDNLRRVLPRYRTFLIYLLGIGLFVTAFSKLLSTIPGGRQKLLESILSRSELLAAIIVIAGVAILGIQFMLRYLRNDFDSTDRSDRIVMREAMRRLIRLERSGVGLNPTDRKALIDEMKLDAAKQMSEEFTNQISQKYAAALEPVRRAEYVRASADRMLERLKTEIRALMRRGNLNLVIGTATTVIAAGVLAYVALTITFAADDWKRYLSTFLMRLSVVVFIEIFAFFFLRLYRASLTEIKYFQNEITNLEAKCLALELAALSNDQAAATKVMDELAKTERNFKLMKEETTVELEKARLESQQMRDFIAAVKEIVPAAKGKSASA